MRRQLELADLIRLYRPSLEHALKDAEAGDLWKCDCEMCMRLQGDTRLYRLITRAAWKIVMGTRDREGWGKPRWRFGADGLPSTWPVSGRATGT